NLLLRRLTPFYAIILVILASALLNQAWTGAINAVLKWLYLIVFEVTGYLAMQRIGSGRLFRSFAVIFAGPIVFQCLAIRWGLKVTNDAGSTSLLGGKQQHQAFRIIPWPFLYLTLCSQA